jgi:hypothetical protein
MRVMVFCLIAVFFAFEMNKALMLLASGLWNGEFGGDLLSHG